MRFKELEWKDSISEGIIICSSCQMNICGYIKIEFRIEHQKKEDAYNIYNDEMCKIKKAIDYLLE